MAVSKIPVETAKQCTQRLLMARTRLLINNGFFGLLLMHVNFGLKEGLQTAATNGKSIFFDPKFMDRLSDSELDFVMMHEVLHMALRHCTRRGDRDRDMFNIACDIVVNSNILKANNMDISSITLTDFGESMHLAPDGKEGYEYTAEEVYEMLKQFGKAKDSGGKNSFSNLYNSSFDSHELWGSEESDEEAINDAIWESRIRSAKELTEIRQSSTGIGNIPACIARHLKELTEGRTDWRTILNDFIQEDITDYSFMPPDRRFSDSPFFLPDFNEKEESISNILFMIDTSGSVDDKIMTVAYSEIVGAIEQFDEKLRGWLGFFDAAVVEPQPFTDRSELLDIKPKGGGGTRFDIIFHYVEQHMQDEAPNMIIILTDGYAAYPPESAANGIPVLWLLNNNDVTPPWGKIARIPR